MSNKQSYMSTRSKIGIAILLAFIALAIADFITTLYGASLITTIIEHLNYNP